MRPPILCCARSTLRTWMLAGTCSALLCSQAAHAGLGATAETVKADQMRFNGVHSESTNGPMTTHEIRLSDGSGIKEYVNAAGVVFAVSWRTRLKPNLEALLGSEFAAHVATAGAAPGVAGIKRQQSIRLPNLVVHQAGRMNAFVGLAYIPTQVPGGINAEALR